MWNPKFQAINLGLRGLAGGWAAQERSSPDRAVSAALHPPTPGRSPSAAALHAPGDPSEGQGPSGSAGAEQEKAPVDAAAENKRMIQEKICRVAKAQNNFARCERPCRSAPCSAQDLRAHAAWPLPRAYVD